MARLHALYTEVSQHRAWRDYMARVQRMRDSIASEILSGTLDKFGNNRDDEKRAVLSALERLLAFVPTLDRQYEELTKRKEQQELRAAKNSGIHGDDVLTSGRGIQV